MSKKQKLITAEEWSVEEHIKSLLTLRGFSKEKIINNRGLIGAVIEDMEEYAQAKVLEALEEKSKTAESILGTLNDMHSNDEISYDRYTYLFEKVASIQLDETEVKPKYE